ncbi:hypothetical protein FsymDg_1934 [Candidatus Protofrankia datiscae]|uniref:Uncharacterized protein n=1 Tax=Candidatus Protofrankia datiscae TaxID=2716812 RepID=F8B4A4_9ACTN|nr:hypothetical protein FsymDg_1934 [Candidatus Protofrankia datiscae]
MGAIAYHTITPFTVCWVRPITGPARPSFPRIHDLLVGEATLPTDMAEALLSPERRSCPYRLPVSASPSEMTARAGREPRTG